MSDFEKEANRRLNELKIELQCLEEVRDGIQNLGDCDRAVNFVEDEIVKTLSEAVEIKLAFMP